MNDATMILFLNADQTTALYNLQVKLFELVESFEDSETPFDEHAAKINDAIDLYRRVMCPTYEPKKN